MDFTGLFKEIKKASLFDLTRIVNLIDYELESPERISEVKRKLKPGMRISYFEPSENRVVDAVIIELRRTRIVVKNDDDHKKYLVQYAAVNLEGISTDISFSPGFEGLDRSELKVGDTVGFHHNDEEFYGKIIKLNPKKAKIKAPDGKVIWAVPYPLLFRVLEGNTPPGSKIIVV